MCIRDSPGTARASSLLVAHPYHFFSAAALVPSWVATSSQLSTYSSHTVSYTHLLTGPSITDPANYDPNIFSDPRDREALRASLRQGRAMAASSPLAEEWGAREIYPGPDVVTEADEDAYMDRTVTTYHHQVGTCRMGTCLLYTSRCV